jgi:beta-N-acetylhexosaminidase
MSALPSDLGQLLVIKVEDSAWTASLERLLRRYRPLGVLFHGPRNAKSAAELTSRATRALEFPSLLGLEEEGGAVDPLRAFLPPLPSPRAAAERGLSAVSRLGELAGSALKLLGFNANCAPLLDLGGPGSKGPPGFEGTLATRAFASDPRHVARCGEAFIHGLRRHQILACAKHFPGLGGLRGSSTPGLAVISKPMAQLWHEDLVPYRQLLTQLPLVLVSHAAYKAYDFDVPRPAAHSVNVLEGLLRVKLRYEGLAVADVAKTEDAQEALDLGEKAVRSVKAGCDVLLLEGCEKPAEVVLTALEKALDAGRLSAERLEQSFKRIRLLRKSLAPPGGKISRTAVDQLARQFEDFSRETLSERGPRSHPTTHGPRQEPRIA